MILRDHLAYERTAMANERTWLAYLRTAIGFMAAGGSIIKFFAGDLLMQISGWGLLSCSVFCAIWGWRRYRAVKNKLKHLELVE
jgi:putative membrane protein